MPKKKKEAETAAHDQWRYKDGEGKIFREGDTIPDGWKDTP